MIISNNSYSDSARPKLLIADDHHLILDGLQAMMRMQFEIVTVDNGRAFIDQVNDFHPDVAILDVGMPNGDGFLTAQEALKINPCLPIIFLSMYRERSYIQRAVQVGAKAFLCKRVSAEELMAAINVVLDGGTLLELPPTTDEDRKSGLTIRQCEVLRLIAAGCTAKDIANRLNISVRTAEFHRAAIMQRLSLHSTAQMTRYAMTNNLS